MSSNRDRRPIECPYCLDGTVLTGGCETCGKSVNIRSGIPSVTRRDTGDEYAKKLEILANEGGDSLDNVLMQVRDDYMDGSIVDRFFKTRTANWRVLVAPYLRGRGLVVGNHDEKVAILLSEVLNDVYAVDTSVTRLRAQRAVAEESETRVKPLHGEVDSLPFPANSFDVVVIQCRASEVDEYLSNVREYISTNGSVLVLVDGWPRETGLTEPVGLGEPPSGVGDRIRSSLRGHSSGIRRLAQKEGFSVTNRYALLSTNRHENERGFDVQSQAALDWLLHGSSKTATASPFQIARLLSQTARKAGVLQQCYPRYLFVCKPESEKVVKTNKSEFPEAAILISGKNRSTVLEFDKNNIARIRKVPNSRCQAQLNKNACDVTSTVTGSVAETVPDSTLVSGPFGAERHEKPVRGTPLDQTLETTPESVDRHLKIVFDWLVEFQKENTVRWVKKEPAAVEEDLTVESVGLSDPPAVEKALEFPLMISHGDLFGSNIYIENGQVIHVIDWEWAQREVNPVVDSGFFLLQLADYIGETFEDGFQLLFFEDKYASKVGKQIRRFCEKLELEPNVFIQYLSISYIHRIKNDFTINKRLDVDWVTRIQHVWDKQNTAYFEIDLNEWSNSQVID